VRSIKKKCARRTRRSGDTLTGGALICRQKETSAPDTASKDGRRISEVNKQKIEQTGWNGKHEYSLF
jgi:hypothetical protein